MTAIAAATEAAKSTFEAFLVAHHDSATTRIPECVVAAAESAYRAAGGEGHIEVCGHGNRTHPVCGVWVRASRPRRV